MVEKGFKCRGFNKECNKEVEYGKISIFFLYNNKPKNWAKMRQKIRTFQIKLD